jgi:hypothetical protein
MCMCLQLAMCTGLAVVCYGPYMAPYQSWSEAIYTVRGVQHQLMRNDVGVHNVSHHASMQVLPDASHGKDWCL